MNIVQTALAQSDLAYVVASRGSGGFTVWARHERGDNASWSIVDTDTAEEASVIAAFLALHKEARYACIKKSAG